ncbi:hypothetical protein PVAP13_6KG281906 [Panicum virgatum]|uniref:Uncharacterized protein n=1 Tax=Panicum virgatum TaxID=38727 RepID=A0A8T0RFJ3_PANVG|nr:hypothetical protein PVAP13_6KG281906 [Panicum virgatum]
MESRPAYGHRGEVPVRPSLVSLARLREVEAEVPPAAPPALDLLLQPRDDGFSSAGVPAASSFASENSRPGARGDPGVGST